MSDRMATPAQFEYRVEWSVYRDRREEWRPISETTTDPARALWLLQSHDNGQAPTRLMRRPVGDWETVNVTAVGLSHGLDAQTVTIDDPRAH